MSPGSADSGTFFAANPGASLLSYLMRWAGFPLANTMPQCGKPSAPIDGNPSAAGQVEVATSGKAEALVADFSVWAPLASRMDVSVKGGSFRMTKGADGWWAATVPAAGPGDDYTFSIDGGPPLPDPRSDWQPHGVSGPSRLVDHAAFRWTDAGFQAKPLAGSLAYELHVGTFTPEGTFEAVIGKLDHLRDLGVTHIELMPVADFPGRFGWGYDGVGALRARHIYGGPTGLKRLVDACHAKGLGVILDVVYNHLGPSGNFLPRFGPYFSGRHKTPWGDALNFDGPHSDFVRRYFCDNAILWFQDYHIDGLRLDAVHAIIDTSAISFLEQLATEVDVLEAHLGPQPRADRRE